MGFPRKKNSELFGQCAGWHCLTVFVQDGVAVAALALRNTTHGVLVAHFRPHNMFWCARTRTFVRSVSFQFAERLFLIW